MYSAAIPDWASRQTILSEPHVAGSGRFRLKNPKVATREPQYTGMVVNLALRLLGKAGEVNVNGWLVVGTDIFHADSFSGGSGDQDWPAGTPIDRAGEWNNSSTNPADRPLSPNFIKDGRDTGYPDGLKPGQLGGFNLFTSSTIRIPAGSYAVRCGPGGNGRVRFNFRYRDDTPDSSHDITFVDGVPSPATIEVPSPECHLISMDLMESRAGSPLYALRLILPGFAAEYDAHADDPFYVVFDEQNLGDLRRGGVARYLDIEAINHSKVIDWDAAEEEKHRRIIARTNAARVDGWFCVPHQATDAYVASLAAYIESHLDPSLHWFLEHSNEVWNGAFQQNGYARVAGAGEFTPLRIASLKSDGVKVTALKAAHGLSTGDAVVFANASDPSYNGQYTVTRIDDDRVSYTPKAVPPAGEATARHLAPLIAYKVPEGNAGVITSAEWRWTSGWEQSYLEFATKGPHGLLGEDIVLISGCADPNVNGIYRADVGNPSAEPNRFVVYYGLQCRSCPLPATTGAGEPAPIVAAPGQVMRVMKLAGNPTAPHVMDPVKALQRWHAHRSKQIFEAAYAASAATPGRFRGGILGLWAASGSNAQVQDYLLDEYGGSVPAEYKIFPAIAPYIYVDDTTGITDASVAGDLRRIGTLTASGGIATVSGPYTRLEGATSAEHGLSTGDKVNVVNAFQPEYCGPTTITAISPTQFTFPLPAGAKPTSPATPYSLYAGIGVVPLPAWGREIVDIGRDGDTLILRSPRHGFAIGDAINVGGFNWPQFDGQYTVASVPDPDTFTVIRPGTTFSPPNPINPYEYARPWAFSHAIVDLLLDDVEKHVDGRFDSVSVKPASEEALARGMVPVFYEFATGFVPYPAYYNAEPVNLVYQAGNRDPRIRGILAKCFARAYSRDIAMILYYGHCYGMSQFGSYAPKEYQQQVDAPKWLAIEDARALFGPASDGGPTFEIRPKMAETSTPANFTAVGSGTSWDGSTSASVAGGTGASLDDFAVLDATHTKLRLAPGSSPDILSVTIGETSRPVVVYQAPPRSFFLDTPFVRAGETRRVTLTGLNTLWDGSTRFSATGGSLSNVEITSPTSATASLATGPGLGTIRIDDGQGSSLTIPVVAEVIVDKDDDGYAESGSWTIGGSGHAGSLRYRTAEGPDVTASWTLTAPVSGWWGYQVDWMPDGNRTQDAIYVVRKNGVEVASHAIDQRKPSIGPVPAGDLNFQQLGGVSLEAGDTLQVELHAASGGGLVADACRFITAGADPLPPDIVVDDSSPGFAKTGSWNRWGAGYGYNSFYSGDPTAKATWTTVAPESGTYEVYADWSGDVSHAMEAHYRFLRDGEEVGSYIMDQRKAAQGDTPAGNYVFQKLGSAEFEAGQAMALEVTSNAGFLKVDAARFLKAGPPAKATKATGFAIAGPTRLTVGIAGGYTVRPEGGALEVATTVALSDGGKGGTWSPASLAFSQGATTGQTAAYTPAKAGDAILEAMPSPSLGTPPIMTISVAAASARSGTFKLSPTKTPANKPVAITFAGTDTDFGGLDQTEPTVSGGAGASIGDFTFQSATQATATLNPGSTPGTLTIKIGDMAATMTVEEATTTSPKPRPAEIIIDDGGPGYSETGSWLPWGSGAGGSQRYHGNWDPAPSTATWTVTDAAAGAYDIQAVWNGDQTHASAVRYTVRVNGSVVGTYVADQRPGSAGGPEVGPYTFGTIASGVSVPEGATISLEVSGNSDGTVVADQARFAYNGPAKVPTLEVSPATMVAGRSTTIRLTGTHTAWSEETRFTVSGGAGATITNKAVESATSATLTIGAGPMAGTLTVSDGTAEAAIKVTPAPQVSITLAPTSATAGTPLTITATGSNTDFGGPGQVSATVSGGDGAAITGFSASSPTSATFTLVPGRVAGTLTVTIGSASSTITVAPSVTVPHGSSATGYDVILPASLMVGQAATAVVVLTGGIDLAAPLVVTLAGEDATIGGTVTIPHGSTYGTTTYSPTTSGTHPVSATHTGGNAGMTDPSPASVIAIKPISGEPGAGLTLEQVQGACAAAIAATPATVKDKTGFGLSAAERAAIAVEVQAQIVADSGDKSVLGAITDRIARINPSLSAASLDAIAAKLAATPVGVKAGGITAASFAPNSAVPLPTTPPAGYGGSSLTTDQVQSACSAAINATPAAIKAGGISSASFASGTAVPLPSTAPAGYGGGSSGSTLTTAQVQGACAAAIAATPATVGTVKDKTGYVLASSGLDAIGVEPGINARQALSPILAASAGIISGAGTGVINIKGGNSATTRITAITDNAGNRSSIQLNLPS